MLRVNVSLFRVERKGKGAILQDSLSSSSLHEWVYLVHPVSACLSVVLLSLSLSAEK